MAGYPHLSQIQDAATRACLKSALDRITALERQVTTLQSTALTRDTTIDAGGLRLTNLATPTAESDAVTVASVRAIMRAEQEAFET